MKYRIVVNCDIPGGDYEIVKRYSKWLHTMTKENWSSVVTDINMDVVEGSDVLSLDPILLNPIIEKFEMEFKKLCLEAVAAEIEKESAIKLSDRLDRSWPSISHIFSSENRVNKRLESVGKIVKGLHKLQSEINATLQVEKEQENVLDARPPKSSGGWG